MSDNTSQNQDPNVLLRPKVKITKLGKRPLYLLIAGALILAAILVYAVDVSTRKAEQIQEQQQTQDEPDGQPAVINPGNSAGIIQPNKPETSSVEEEKKDTPLLVVQTSTRNPREEARQRELAKIRQNKLHRMQQAYIAPLRINTPIPKVAAANQAQPANVVRTGMNMADTVHARHPYGTGGANTLPANSGGSGGAGYNPSAQRDKEGFLKTRSAGDSRWQLEHARTAGMPYELKTGAVIPGIMLTGINSDLPGQIIGQVSQNVYDTASGNHLLIPQGSRMIGVYDSRVAFGQKRVLVAWNRIVFPDGSSITLGSMPGADMAGYGGLEDESDNRYLQIFGSAAIMSLISGISAYASDTFTSSTAGNQKASMQDQLGTALTTHLGQAGTQILQRNLNVQPTLAIRPGYRFNMVATKDIVFNQPYSEWR